MVFIFCSNLFLICVDFYFVLGAVLLLGIVLVTKPSFIFAIDYNDHKLNSSLFPNASESRTNLVQNGEIESVNGHGTQS